METKTCPKCGKQMIRRYRDYVLLTYPVQRPWDWWCGCGYSEEGGIELDKTEDQIVREQWEIVNDASVPTPPA